MTQARRWVAADFGGPEVLEEIIVELPAPAGGEVTVEVRAAGMNPADYKRFGRGQDPKLLPLTIGSEVAGVIAALGPDTQIASGGGAVGDGVVAFPVSDGYSSAVSVRAADVFAKPPTLTFPQAANLLLVGTTAAETLDVVRLAEGEKLLVHGAAGGVGSSVVQQARALGASVIGTAHESDFDAVRDFGGIPVAYGRGLEERIRRAAPEGVDAAVDTVGVDEALDVSLALVADRRRIRPPGSGAQSATAFRSSAPSTRAVGRSAPQRARRSSTSPRGES